jgi:hypothetical protein
MQVANHTNFSGLPERSLLYGGTFLAVRAVIDRMMEASLAGDVDTVDALLSDRPGCIYINTDPDEWWDKAMQMAWMRDAVSSGELVGGELRVAESLIRVEPGEVTVHVLDNVAWAEGTGKIVNGQGGERVVRSTGVFINEDGGWQCVQQHVSIGVPNQDIFTS